MDSFLLVLETPSTGPPPKTELVPPKGELSCETGVGCPGVPLDCEESADAPVPLCPVVVPPCPVLVLLAEVVVPPCPMLAPVCPGVVCATLENVLANGEAELPEPVAPGAPGTPVPGSSGALPPSDCTSP